jgi:GNAT superfamily N-acetyltransferase
MSGIIVRGGTAADRDFVIGTARRLAAFGPPPWRSIMEVVAGEVRCLDDFFDGGTPDPGGPTLFLAEQSGDSMGFAFLEPAVDYFSGEAHGHVGMIAVTEAAEGRGAGAALMRAAEEWARSRGYPKLTLNVFEGNQRARQVYERLGYQVETLRYVKHLG